MTDNNGSKKPQRLTLAFLFASFGEQVVKQLAADETTRVFPFKVFEKLHTPRENFESDAEYKREVVTPVMEAFLDKICPSAKNKALVVQWVIKQYLSHRHNGKPILAEDFYKANDNLKYFEGLRNAGTFKSSGDSPDLLSYKTYAAFEQMLEPHLKRKARQDMLKEMFNMTPERKEQLMAETTLLYDGHEGRVVIVHTFRASQYWGNNTKWCIAAKHQSAERLFEHYNARSPVVMIMPKGQSDNKIALVDKIFYNSEDKTIAALPMLHDELMQRCTTGLSEHVQKILLSWMPGAPAPARTRAPIDETLCAAVEKEILAIKTRAALSPKLWGNRDFVRAVIQQSGVGYPFENASPALRADPEFLLSVVRYEPRILEYVCPSLLKDREFFLAAVKKSGDVLHYGSQAFRADRELVAAAVLQHGKMLGRASLHLQGDRVFIYGLIEKSADLVFQSPKSLNVSWWPDKADLLPFQIQRMEEMIARGETGKFSEYARHIRGAWGDPDTLFATDPAATLEKIRAEIQPKQAAKPMVAATAGMNA